MPVYLLTGHAYRSWSEANPRGYVQHGGGVQAPNPELAARRARQARFSPMRFDHDMQMTLHNVTIEVAAEADYAGLAVHAASVTPSHLHALVVFAQPKCIWEDERSARGQGSQGRRACARGWCRAPCPGRRFAEAWFKRVKSIGGYRLAKQTGRPGRKWFSRGWDITAVRSREHYNHLIDQYLPKHEHEGGSVRRYR